MMLATTLQGFTIGLAMIIPIGAQNAFVLSRGIHRNHHLLTATLCSLCDLTLIAIGVFGGANVLAASPLGMALLTWGACCFSAGLVAVPCSVPGVVKGRGLPSLLSRWVPKACWR